MVFQNFIEIQLVYAVAGSNHHIRLMAVFQPGKILINRIRCSTVPPAVADSHGGREHEQAALLTSEIPPLGRIQMFVQRTRVVLCQDRYFLNMRVRHTAQRKIDAPEASRHGHGRDGSFVG